MRTSLSVAMCQINPTVGDLEGNSEKIIKALEDLKLLCAPYDYPDLIIFPELVLTGYPPMDLLLNQEFLNEVARTRFDLETKIAGVVPTLEPRLVVFGSPTSSFGRLFNTAVVLGLHAGMIILHAKVDKQLLPTYDVFDETRYFTPAPAAFSAGPIRFLDFPALGIHICEDIWEIGYKDKPVTKLVEQGAEVLVNLSASPYNMHKVEARDTVCHQFLKPPVRAIFYCNQMGANDEIIFDGRSTVYTNHETFRAPAFKEAISIYRLKLAEDGHNYKKTSGVGTLTNLDIVSKARYPNETYDLIDALCLGIRDYMSKTGFFEAVIGLSGGIDSALVATLAARALGPDRVHCVMMPSKYSSEGSINDSIELCKRLGINDLKTIRIDPFVADFNLELYESCGDVRNTLVEENLQARNRGTLLMALSNRYNWLVLSTGNKSEMAVGYCTLYGDMCGGLAVIGDLYKTQVYKMARELKIPEAILLKAPSAELAPGQKDSDSLPPYDVLDMCLVHLIEPDCSGKIDVSLLYPEPLEKVRRMLSRAEYKRRQAPPVLRVSPKAFGTGRRMPIAQGYVR